MAPLRFAGETLVYVIYERLAWQNGGGPDRHLLLFLFWLLISALGYEPLAYIKWPFVSFTPPNAR